MCCVGGCQRVGVNNSLLYFNTILDRLFGQLNCQQPFTIQFLLSAVEGGKGGENGEGGEDGECGEGREGKEGVEGVEGE